MRLQESELITKKSDQRDPLLKSRLQGLMHCHSLKGSLAEWSKAPASGASSKERGFDPHRVHFFSFSSCFFCFLAEGK